MTHVIAIREKSFPLFAKLVTGTVMAGALMIGSWNMANAEEIDVAVVTASLTATLKTVAAESRVNNEYVNFMRTNEELGEISAMCEFAESAREGIEALPPACADADATEMKYLPVFGGNGFGAVQVSHLVAGHVVPKLPE